MDTNKSFTIISVSFEDIQAMRDIRDGTSNECAFLVSEDTITTYEGDYSYVDIPLPDESCDYVIGHSHPCCYENKYNPPSKEDIIAAIDRPFQRLVHSR